MRIDHDEPPDDDDGEMVEVEAEAVEIGRLDLELQVLFATQDFLVRRPNPSYPSDDPAVMRAYDAALVASARRLARAMDADLPRLDDTLPGRGSVGGSTRGRARPCRHRRRPSAPARKRPLPRGGS